MPSAPPVRVQVVVDDRDLGIPLGRYRYPGLGPWVALQGVLGLLVGAVGIAALADQPVAGAGITLAAVGLVAHGLARWRHRAIYLFSGGIVVTGAAGRVRQCAPWLDVSVSWSAAGPRRAVGRFHTYRVRFTSRGAVRFGVPARERGIGPRLRMLCAERRFPDALRDFRAGRRIPFGPLLVGPEGVTRTARGREPWTVPWSGLRGVQVGARSVVLLDGRGGRAITLPTNRVPDVDLLAKLVGVAGAG